VPACSIPPVKETAEIIAKLGFYLTDARWVVGWLGRGSSIGRWSHSNSPPSRGNCTTLLSWK